jgi:hypothetical protein
VTCISTLEAIWNENVRVENRVAIMCVMGATLADYNENVRACGICMGSVILHEYEEGVQLGKAFLDMDGGSVGAIS